MTVHSRHKFVQRNSVNSSPCNPAQARKFDMISLHLGPCLSLMDPELVWLMTSHDIWITFEIIFKKRPPALPCPSTKSKVCADGLVLIRSQLCHQPTILLLIQNATQHATYQQRIVRPQPASFIQHQAMSFCQASGMRPFPLQKSAGQTPDLVAFAVWRLPIP